MKNFLLKTWLMLCLLVFGVGTTWADTYVQLTSIANIDEGADYVLGIDGTGFHKSGTSSWGVCTNSGGGTPLKYKLVKAGDGSSFKASTKIGETTYYLTVPTSNTFTMATSSTAANTDMIIGTTQVSGTNYAVANKGTTARHLRLNGTSGLRSYAGTTGTMAFFYKVVPDGPAVTSIAIKTAPTKTTYMVGETFDPSGLVITKTLSDANTADVTYSGNESSFTFSPSLTTELTNETSVSITYGKKTTTQAITVNPFVATAGTYTINTNNGLYGVSTGNNETEQSKIKSGITVVSGCKSSATSKTYYDTDHIRYYADSYLKLTAPAGFEITKVVFTANGTWNSGPKCGENGTYNNTTKTWEGSTSQLDLTFSDQNRIKSIAVTYAAESTDPEKELIGIEATGTPAEFWKGDEFNHNGITVTALWDDETETNVTSLCEFSGYNMSTPGQQTVTVTYQGETDTYNIEVKTIANTQATAYTVARAKALIDAGKDLSTEVFVKGTVSEIVTAWSDQYNNITYAISDDGQTTGTQFQLFRCATNGAEVGDDVVALGTLTKHNETYEFAADNSITKIEKAATLSIADITVANGDDITPVITTNVIGEYTIEYTSDNEEVVLADGDEMVTMGAGTATITATLTAVGYKDVQTTFNVTVTTGATVTSVTLSGELTKKTYTIGDAFDHSGLVATANYSDDTHIDVTETATWEVDPEELTTAGNITVTVSASFGGQEDIQEYEVTVNKKTATITFAPATIDVEVGKNITLEPTTTPADAEIRYTITEGSEYVSIENGVVTGVAEGTATIRADFDGNDEYNAASTTVTINVIPAVNKVTFDLSKDETTTATESELSWVTTEVTMLAEKGKATTNANNYYPGTAGKTYTSTRFYANSTLTITPAAGITITKVEYTATTDAFATALANSTWNNASASASETLVTITPTDGTRAISATIGANTGATSVVVYYTGEAAPALSSIALSGTYPTVFNKGDEFSHEGMTVTANYTDGSDADVTSSATFTGYDMNTLGEQTVTVSYTEDEITKTAQYQITVNKAPFVPTVVPEGYEVVDFAALYSSVTTNATVEGYEGTSFAMAFEKPQSSSTPTKYYDNGKAVRAYPGNTITITAAEPIKHVDIDWTVEDDAVSITDLGTTTAVITFSKNCRFTAILVGYRSESITLAATDGEDYYATFSSDKAVVFEGGATVYAVSAEGTTLSLNEIAGKDVPANTGVLVKTSSTTATYHYILNAAPVGKNDLYPASKDKAEFVDYYFYMLAYGDEALTPATLGFYWGAANGGTFVSREGSAYLALRAEQTLVSGFTFGDIEDAIAKVKVEAKGNGELYNMAGQKVSKNYKGIVIVNGKKMLNK